ncbi:hypothetical protein [Pseudomonas asiatica]|uniref:hypothetical protein n=1 Tax=Pseudomonas asiatica TaxID=2219225 RepID=UPI001484EE93|nr:hypothetical protein [Pseudomonas asiatica]
MNNVSLISFINLLHNASLVQMTLSGLTTRCTAKIEQTDSTITLLRLLWSSNCETLILAEALSVGHWVDDTFHCLDIHGREVTLQLLQTTTIKPDCSTSNELDALLRDLLLEANRRGSSNQHAKCPAGSCLGRFEVSPTVAVPADACNAEHRPGNTHQSRATRRMGLGLDAATA